ENLFGRQSHGIDTEIDDENINELVDVTLYVNVHLSLNSNSRHLDDIQK
ncbi:877_t:CDS:1, partial [Entrophospora sp. SA101]